MNVRTSNFISQVTLRTAFEAGALAWAAVALRSPIGALGGAAFGATKVISRIPIALFTTQCLNSTNAQASEATKTLEWALLFFGSYAIAWGALAAAGFTLAFADIVVLTACSWVTSFALDTLLGFMGIDTEKVFRS